MFALQLGAMIITVIACTFYVPLVAVPLMVSAAGASGVRDSSGARWAFFGGLAAAVVGAVFTTQVLWEDPVGAWVAIVLLGLAYLLGAGMLISDAF